MDTGFDRKGERRRHLGFTPDGRSVTVERENQKILLPFTKISTSDTSIRQTADGRLKNAALSESRLVPPCVLGAEPSPRNFRSFGNARQPSGPPVGVTQATRLGAQLDAVETKKRKRASVRPPSWDDDLSEARDLA